jgi:hypothetical protein
MTDITPLSDMLNWKLLPGPHDCPGPDGGTCINEAAIIAAGFEYRKVDGSNDCPPCFSRPIAQYAIGLNDQMPDDLRQLLLMPFVVRLAGTADTDAVEIKRAKYMVIETVRRILPLVLTRWPKLAEQCRRVRTLDQARRASAAAEAANTAAFYAADAADASNAAYAAYAAEAAAYAAYAAETAAYAVADAATYTADATADAVAVAQAATYAAAEAAVAEATVWQEAVSILDEAIALGKQAEPLDMALVVHRMAQAREMATQAR